MKTKDIRHDAENLHFIIRYYNLYISCCGYQNTEVYSICVVERWGKSCSIYPPYYIKTHCISGCYLKTLEVEW